MKNVIFACHTLYLPGGKLVDSHAPFTFETFNHYFKTDYQVIRHSLTTGGESRLYRQGISGPYRTIPGLGSLPDSARYIGEAVYNFFYLLFQPLSRTTFVAIDPLSCIAGSVLKKIGFGLKVIFITPDYARVRFKNKLLNYAYFTLDKFCTKNCDVNFCMSRTVIDYKKKLYGDGTVTRTLRHVPHTPGPWLVESYRNTPKVPGRIIYVGIISSQLNFFDICKNIFELRTVDPRLHLIIIGEGDTKAELEQFVKDNQYDTITFLSSLDYHRTLQEVAKAEVGIALYNGTLNYDEFRDSFKIRDYQAFGTIPLASAVVKSNSDEISKYGSGLIIDNTPEAIKTALLRVFSEPELKKQLSAHCLTNYNLHKDSLPRFYSEIINP